MNNSSETMYSPSPVVVAAQLILSTAAKVLPRKTYQSLYNFSFRGYRFLIRFLYLRRGIAPVISGNTQNLHRVSTIFRVMPFSLVGWKGLEATYDAVLSIQQHDIPGSIVECGVAQGGSAALMALLNSKSCQVRRLWLMDSYEGLPDPTEEDYQDGKTGAHVQTLSKGSCLGTYEQVEDLLFNRLHLNRNEISMVKGWFQNTLPENRDQIGFISLLRIDADWYESVKCCLENLYDQVVPGGYVIIDDYSSCFGAQKALDEFIETRRIRVQLVHDGRGGCLFVKPA